MLMMVLMYHPAAALHQRSLRPVLDADFARLPELITQAADVPEVQLDMLEEDANPTQLSLF